MSDIYRLTFKDNTQQATYAVADLREVTPVGFPARWTLKILDGSGSWYDSLAAKGLKTRGSIFSNPPHGTCVFVHDDEPLVYQGVSFASFGQLLAEGVSYFESTWFGDALSGFFSGFVEVVKV